MYRRTHTSVIRLMPSPEFHVGFLGCANIGISASSLKLFQSNSNWRHKNWALRILFHEERGPKKHLLGYPERDGISIYLGKTQRNRGH